ncbi:hypothetical protein LLEC1_01428 [Akanthomyces lecanii]|uniref:Zn(2)-C6 fungal-type domain-containing protein n=1 Tax=Cordyceps confragosa TaxID=2714763 RepID=A0A179I584_CORDF|nr:hypothetical protein LLEC1_01428 [Akanthomyces lecanii]
MSPGAAPNQRRSGDAGGQDSSAPRVRRWAPRSRTGCLGCRARRVKCDELRPKCKSCLKRNINCHYELHPPGAGTSLDAMHEASVAAQPTPSMRGWRDQNTARHVKCGEQQPTCRRCVEPGYAYSGLLSPPPQPWAAPECEESRCDATSSSGFSRGDSRPSQVSPLLSPGSRALTIRRQRKWPTRQGQDVSPAAEVLPPDWYYTEAVFYCKFCPTYFYCYYTIRVQMLILLVVNTCLLDKISKVEAIPIKYHRPVGSNEANYDAFIAFILAYRITQISQERGNVTQPSEAYHTKHLWERLYTCISNQITCINHELARMSSSDATKNRILARIQGIKCVELMLQSPVWKHHTEGFLSLLSFCGGAKFAQGRHALIKNTKGIIMESVLANSVSPPNNQIVGVSSFSTEELIFFYDKNLHPSFPCPTELFERIVEINNLRVHVYSSPSPEQRAGALAILQRIDAFQPLQWVESSYELPDRPEVPLMASIYQLAVGLFGVMALQAAGLGTQDKAGRRSSLVTVLAAAWKLEHCRDALNWPLAVAGCALADGGASSERAFVCQCLEDAAKHVFAVHPLLIMAKLKQFWESGMVQWDRCWGELCPIVG